METNQAVRNVSLFKGLPEEQLDRLAEITVCKRYRKNELIFESDTPANGFYATLSGKVKIYRMSLRGKSRYSTSSAPANPLPKCRCSRDRHFRCMPRHWKPRSSSLYREWNLKK